METETDKNMEEEIETVVLHELQSKLLVSPFTSPIVVPIKPPLRKLDYGSHKVLWG